MSDQADNKDKPAEAAAPKDSGKAAKGAKGVSVVVLAVLVVLGAVSSAAGAAFGPHLAGKVMKPKSAHHEEEDEPEEPPAAETITLEPLIVDIRDSAGELHHLRIGIAIELKKPLHDEEEVKKLAPPARDAAIEYTRSLAYDDATSPKKFESIRVELGERIARAIGKGKVKRVLFTDFVVQ